MSAWLWIGAALAGGAGAVARWLVESLAGATVGRGLPWGTTAANLSGAFLLGLLAGLAPSEPVRILLATGALGAYTTFSGWILATDRLGRELGPAAAVANLVLPLLLGLATVVLGRFVGGLL